jgi:hypothetical protein
LSFCQKNKKFSEVKSRFEITVNLILSEEMTCFAIKNTILQHSFEFKFLLDFKRIIFNMNFTFIAKKILSLKKSFKDLPNEEMGRK